MSKDAIFKQIELARLKPYERNPRKNDAAVDALAQSIRANGFRSPILVDENGVILAGHTRYKAALKLGLKRVPCVVYGDMGENQKRAFRIADNKLNELARWDFAALEKEIDEIDWGDLAEEAGSLDWGGEDVTWPADDAWDLQALGFSESEAAGMQMDAEVGAMLDSFEGTSPVRDREQRRAEEAAGKGENWEDGDTPTDKEIETPDAVTFIAKGNFQDFGEDFWKLAGELYARGIKTETKWGKK